jgi:hypothetical protein
MSPMTFEEYKALPLLVPERRGGGDWAYFTTHTCRRCH